MNFTIPEWPLPSTKHQTLYLDGTSRLSPGKAVDEGSYSYQSDAQALQADCDPEEIRFEYTFTETSYLVGYSKATLFVSCQEHDDMDVFVQLRKADAKGNLLQWLNVPAQALGMAPQDVPSITPLKYLGPTGILRASHRKLDGNLSKPYRPVPSHSAIEKVSPGTIVKLEIGIWPTAIAFEKGEKLVLKISGHNMMLAEFVPLRGSFTSGNQGRHHIHFGGENNSSIDVPFVQLM